MAEIKEIVQLYKSAEKDKIFPFSEWHRKDVFERLVKPFLIKLGYNPDQIDYNDARGTIELKIRKDLKVIVYVSSIQEEQRFLSNKISAPIDTIPDSETGKSEYEIAVVSNFEKWFFYFDGQEIYAVAVERLEKELETIELLISRDAIESGKFKEFARKLLHKEDNEPLRQELNVLREKIADKILQEKTNSQYLKNPDGSYNNEILNEITTRWITRFLSLKLAEDSGMTFNFTLRDIRKSFGLYGKTAKPIPGAKVKEETLSNAIRALINEFERRFNGGVFMYEEGVDYITIPDSAFFDLLDFVTGWAFTVEDARVIGFVYERFLGQEIVVEEKEGRTEAVLKNIGEARGRRKAGGIYYTPKYIVDYIVENTLGEVLKEKEREMDNAVNNLDVDRLIELLREVKSLYVLDPSCGSGSFLIKVLAEFKNSYEDIKYRAKEIKRKIDVLRKERTKGQMLFIKDKEDKEIIELEDKYAELQKEIDEIKFPGTFALRHNIYGVDLDPKAIDITTFTLMVQVYDELKEGARCPTMIGENLKVGNSLISAIVPDERKGFISRKEVEKFKDEISNLIKLREVGKGIDTLDDGGLRKLLKENFDDVVDVYLHIKKSYPNAIPTPQQNLLDEWHEKAKNEPIEKTFDVLINQTGLARIFLKEVYFRKIEEVEERIEGEINSPLIKYFNSEKRVLKDKEFEEILADGERVKEELRFVKDRAVEISKSQPSKVFNWEIEFPEVFFNEDGTLKENPGFDVVVGNPPYGADVYESYKTFLNESFISMLNNQNVYSGFIQRSLDILQELGLHSFIVQSSFYILESFRTLREFIFTHSKILNIVNFDYPVFKETGSLIDTCVIVLRKSTNFEENLKNNIRLNRNIDTILGEIPQSFLFSLPNHQIQPRISKKDLIIIKKIEENKHLFGSLKKSFRGVSSRLVKQKGELKVFGGSGIGAYCTLKPKGFTDTGILSKSQKNRLLSKKIVIQRIRNLSLTRRLVGTILLEDEVPFETLTIILLKDPSLSLEYSLGLLNSSLLNYYAGIRFNHMHIESDTLDFLPIVRATPDQQAPIISLVDAIIQKKKEYHAISQNIEDYVDFKAAQLIRLDEFLKIAVEDFEVLSSLRVRHDNFDALRVKTEDDEVILEYGTRRKTEEYEEIDEEDESVEVRGNKYVIEWQEAGRGKIKDKEAIIFLEEILEKEKRISKAQTKTIWQKIAEVKIPEFSDEAKQGFLRYNSAMEKAKILDEEILKIDRAIDRLVYDLYGLTEDEVKVVEQSVWGDKFERMYSMLPAKERALELSQEVMSNGSN